MDHLAFSILFPCLYLETLEEKFRVSSTRQAFFFSSHFGLCFGWLQLRDHSLQHFGANPTNQNHDRELFREKLVGVMQLLNKLFSWMRNFETVVDWYLSVSEDCYHFQGSLLWMMKLLNTISSHTPPSKYGLLGFFPLLLCGLSKSLLPIWLCTPAPHRHSSIHTDMHACRGDLYTQLFLICTWLLLWLNFEKKGHVIRNFHSSKHKRVPACFRGQQFFIQMFLGNL